MLRLAEKDHGKERDQLEAFRIVFSNLLEFCS